MVVVTGDDSVSQLLSLLADGMGSCYWGILNGTDSSVAGSNVVANKDDIETIIDSTTRHSNPN